MSSTQAIDTGVPQGSILGPVLFLVYLNDFCCVIESGSILLFADDATYYDSDSDKKYDELRARINQNLEKIRN